MGEEENFAFQYQRDKRKTRIELVTYRAAIDCSTTELFPLKVRRVGLNYRPSGHEPDTLPTELHRMVTLTGVEPATSGLWVRHSPVELQCIAWISTIQSPTKYYLLIMSRCPTRRADNKLVWYTYLNRPLISYIRLFSCVFNHNG